MSERVYKLLNGSELLVSEEVMGVRQTPDGMPITVDGDYVIDDVLALVDRLRKELEEARKIRFPRQADGEGGWTIDYDFLDKLETRAYKGSDYSMDLEDLETVLLALEKVLGQEGEGSHEPDRS